MKIVTSNFNLDQIATSGQCFRWCRIKDESISGICSESGIDDIYEDTICYAIPAYGYTLIALQKENNIYFSCNETAWNEIWSDYFDIKRDYGAIGNKIMSSKDSHLKECFVHGSGIRILKQDLNEVIFSFMISQNNNIKRISGSIEAICAKFGQFTKCYDIAMPAKSDSYDYGYEMLVYLLNKKYGNSFYIFPNFEDMPENLFDNISPGLGYREEYLMNLRLLLINHPDLLDELKRMNYKDAVTELMKIKGIGAKVANCIALFGLSFVEAFPIDTHMKQIMIEYYPKGIDLRPYADEAGIIQQYLFYHSLR